MKTKALSLFLAFVLLCTLTACSGKPGEAGGPAAPGSAGTGTRMFTDDCGREVEIPDEISAIVPSGPLSQIILFALAPEMLVGLASRWSDSAEGIVDEAYLDLPYFGQLYGSASLNVEELVLAAPQLIVDVGEAKGALAEDLDDLQTQTMIPAVHVEASLDTMAQAFRKLGALLGREEKGEALARFCESVYERTSTVMDKVGDNKVDALYVLGEHGQNVLAKGSYHAELIDILTNNLAVVENPAGKGTGNEVTMEQIALWNPEFILFAPESIYETAAERPSWKSISAIASGNYIEVPFGPDNWMGSPPAVQRYLGMIWLTAVLYPEYCDYDVKADVLEYYELFYGCTLTDAQYEELTANAFLK